MNIRVYTENGTLEVSIREFPDHCPHCRYAIVPIHHYGFADRRSLYLSFSCVRHECKRFFVVEYERNEVAVYDILRFLSASPKPINHPQIIEKISPDFIELYKQAQAAQDNGLNEICGMGFRKALEFLIKDYIVYKDPSSKEVVEKKLLGDCIKTYIQSPKIKDIANRAAWLGNDETHYVRKWVNMDVTHLKQLINLTTHWIETERLTDEMVKAMPS